MLREYRVSLALITLVLFAYSAMVLLNGRKASSPSAHAASLKVPAAAVQAVSTGAAPEIR